MSYSLRNSNNEELEFSGAGWGFYLNLAEVYGWQPMNTRRPAGFSVFKKWHGRYDSNEGQKVKKKSQRPLRKQSEMQLVFLTIPFK